jgi:hypothetical protein
VKYNEYKFGKVNQHEYPGKQIKPCKNFRLPFLEIETRNENNRQEKDGGYTEIEYNEYPLVNEGSGKGPEQSLKGIQVNHQDK